MNKERLLKIAKHLEKGELIHEIFDFNDYNSIPYNSEKEYKNGCGTSGCAIGEFPAIFPDDWEFRNYHHKYMPRLKGTVDYNDKKNLPSFDEVREYLDIEEVEADFLFTPQDDTLYIFINNDEFHGIEHDATKEEVAKHIREFVRLKKLTNEPI